MPGTRHPAAKGSPLTAYIHLNDDSTGPLFDFDLLLTLAARHAQ
jgi:hypothetical protein